MVTEYTARAVDNACCARDLTALSVAVYDGAPQSIVETKLTLVSRQLA